MSTDTRKRANPSRHYCFTLNNPAEPLDGPALVPADTPHLRYAVWQLESGDSGTIHYQGYMEFDRPTRFGGIAKHCPSLTGAHFEIRRGTREQARDYCQKEDSRVSGPWTVGIWEEGGQGKRSDLEEVHQAIKRGASLIDIAESHPASFIRYNRGIERLHHMLGTPRQRDPSTAVSVILYYGPAGSGKTRAIAECVGTAAYWKSLAGWWDGYNGHSTVVMDDFSGASIAYREFKLVFDRYPCAVQYKGGSQPLLATSFYLSSTRLPDGWWNSERVTEFNLDEISRRITEIRAWDIDRKEFISYQHDADERALAKFHRLHNKHSIHF